MQLVASVFVAIAPVLILTFLVNQDWFWRFSPDWLKQYATEVSWPSLLVGLLALIAAWLGGELHFAPGARADRRHAAAGQRRFVGTHRFEKGGRRTRPVGEKF